MYRNIRQLPKELLYKWIVRMNLHFMLFPESKKEVHIHVKRFENKRIFVFIFN